MPRPKVAFIGVRNEIGSPKLKWLPTAVTEFVTHELAAAESSLRVVAADSIETEHRSLGMTADDVGDEKTQKRLQALLDADVFLHGILSVAEPGTDKVRLRVQALEAGSRKALGSLEEDLGPDGARLVEALSSAGTGIRNLLGVSLSSEEEAALSASRAHNLDAAKVYAEGVMRRQRWDLEDARGHFEAALAADSSFLQAKRELARTWLEQSNEKKAVEVLKNIRATSSALTARQAAMVDLQIAPDRDKLSALFEATPDDLEMGRKLASRLPPRARLQVLKRMKELRAGAPLGLMRLEAMATSEIDLQRSEELLDDVVARATELGARWDLARARALQANLVSPHDPRRRKEALDRFREAERLDTEVGELDNLANVKRTKAGWLFESGSRRDALAAMDEAAGWYRRLGNRAWVAHTLLATADFLRDFGELAAARKRFDEARSELETLEESPDGFMFALAYQVRARQDFDAGNLDAAREGIRQARKTAAMGGGAWPALVELLEACVLNEQDQREEARATYSRAEAISPTAVRGWLDPSTTVAGMCVVDCDGGNPAAGLACLAQKCRADDPNFFEGRKASCQLEDARCSFRAGDLARAERGARETASFAESKEYYDLALGARTVLMRVVAARGESARAIRVLRADLAKVESEKNKRLAFETALALGEVELRAGRREGRARLAKLEQEARSREFFRIARLAREALDRTRLASALPQH